MLDAIICREWDYRYYSYNSKWSANEEMASMRNGCGDEWFLLFNPVGAALKGLAHESPRAGDDSFPAQIQKLVPPDFSSFLQEPAFSMQSASFCLWRRHTDRQWSVVIPTHGSISPNDDGSEELLTILDGEPATYQQWAQDYYERPISLNAVRAIYTHESLNEELIAALNPEVSLPDISGDIAEIGYRAI